MKGKVAIYTMQGYHNYGNLLQNYAVQHIWESLGFEPVTLHFRRSLKKDYAGTAPWMLVKRAFTLLPNSRQMPNRRYLALRAFARRHIPARLVNITKAGALDALGQDYAYFSTGSDQVWNPHFHRPQLEDICFLPFAGQNQRVCMAPSFGVDELPPEHQARFAKGLAGFNHLNVREASGAEVVRRLTGRPAKVLVDPTMAAPTALWDQLIASCSGPAQKNYLLLYFLGPVAGEELEKMRQLAGRHGLTIINMLNPAGGFYTASPAEFIRLIKGAALLCTDSFHGAVFSIIFNRPFVLYDRHFKNVDMNSRAHTLLDTFSLAGRKAGAAPLDDRVFSCSFEAANKTLAEKRQFFLDAIIEQLAPEDRPQNLF